MADRVEKEMDVLGRGKRHSVPDPSKDIAELVKGFQDEDVHTKTPNRTTRAGKRDEVEDFVGKGIESLTEDDALNDWFDRRAGSYDREVSQTFSFAEKAQSRSKGGQAEGEGEVEVEASGVREAGETLGLQPEGLDAREGERGIGGHSTPVAEAVVSSPMELDETL